MAIAKSQPLQGLHRYNGYAITTQPLTQSVLSKRQLKTPYPFPQSMDGMDKEQQTTNYAQLRSQLPEGLVARSRGWIATHSVLAKWLTVLLPYREVTASTLPDSGADISFLPLAVGR